MNKLTYISLFSCAGVGCYGFKQQGFECVATSELIERRLAVQKYNNKCKYDSGYICGDITLDITKNKIFNEIDFWKSNENMDNVTVVIATPPCQGMSVANTFKNENDINRNSLVVEAIQLVKKIKPKFFVFENVPTFLSTNCVDIDNKNKLIKNTISEHLALYYDISFSVLNFAYYGSNSSRTRTLVIGVNKELGINPKSLFPSNKIAPTLKELIGNLPILENMGDMCDTDIYHNFREYPSEMIPWVHNTPEGCSAFDNKNPEYRPHRIVDGKYILNQKSMKHKYSRCLWNKIAPCVLTRTDTISGVFTIHPSRDSVFTIRECMLMQSIPYDFKWSKYDLDYLNKLSLEQKKQYLKDNEINIRQCIGESVPTIIFNQIANKIKLALQGVSLAIPKCDFGTITNKQNYKLF
jgi:DNA (cytosine-5)-methyltransferase 1